MLLHSQCRVPVTRGLLILAIRTGEFVVGHPLWADGVRTLLLLGRFSRPRAAAGLQMQLQFFNFPPSYFLGRLRDSLRLVGY